MLSLLLTALCYVELSWMGFPDGSMTPYERSIIGPLKILAAVCLLQALYFLFVGILRRRLRALSLWLGIGAAAAVVAPILLIPACPDLNLCRAAYERITHTRMAHGQGG